MKSQRAALTPQMLRYDDFDHRSETRWLPYLMYFHRVGYRSEVINTDALGFRISHGAGARASAGGDLPRGPVRLFAGSSTAFGIGSTTDAATIPSRLWTEYAPSVPWLNFAGRSYNSTQELSLFLLYRHLLPEIEEIVVFSGLNNLALARLPEWQRGDHGGFFSCGEYFEQMEELRARHRKAPVVFGRRAERRAAPPEEAPVPPLADRISYAADLTVRHLEGWRLLAGQTGARLSFVMQPLATWVREEHAPQERLLFGELDEKSNFWSLYGDIATKEAGRAYAEALRDACEKKKIDFFDINPVLSEAVREQDWLFVDRAHFTDEGHDIVSRILADSLGLT
ncbi:SGNH/GDSL hydrolase family protein [Streptosporangium sp. NPDC050855]|uniref:SGNH/GDSL hydrolase family protein n=1 Tax=Streptosporangium sp. NPDC050855 TaxID=3366194 RepID=UPI003795D546